LAQEGYDVALFARGEAALLEATQACLQAANCRDAVI
jgi:hypothetical protein